MIIFAQNAAPYRTSRAFNTREMIRYSGNRHSGHIGFSSFVADARGGCGVHLATEYDYPSCRSDASAHYGAITRESVNAQQVDLVSNRSC